MKIFIENFSVFTDQAALKRLFSRYGKVTSLKMLYDYDTDERLGAFVRMQDAPNAQRAIRHLNGRIWNGKRLRVTKKRPGDHDND